MYSLRKLNSCSYFINLILIVKFGDLFKPIYNNNIIVVARTYG